jgi:hypothetical protein
MMRMMQLGVDGPGFAGGRGQARALRARQLHRPGAAHRDS